MDVSNLCILVDRSFQSNMCVVFQSYWRYLSQHVLLYLMYSPFFVCPFCFVIIWWVWKTYCILGYDGCERPAIPCHYFSCVQSFFVCPFCFVIIWWVWETCYTVEYDGCETPVIPCRSFSDVDSFLIFYILCNGLSTFISSYYLQSRLWI